MNKIKLLKKTLEYIKNQKKVKKKKKKLTEEEKNTFSMKEDNISTTGSKPSGKVSPDILDSSFKKGGAVKKRAKSSSKKSRGTGAAIKGTKFKGVF